MAQSATARSSLSELWLETRRQGSVGGGEIFQKRPPGDAVDGEVMNGQEDPIGWSRSPEDRRADELTLFDVE